MLLGLHHITAICSDVQTNVDFYAGLLGLRLVKVTVNFDDPNSYHMYYGDAAGSPGTLMTFFVWPGGRRGRIGPPQVAATSYSAPRASLKFWKARLAERGIASSEISLNFNEPGLRVEDPDGLVIQLVGVDGELPAGYASSGIDPEHSLRAFHSVTLVERTVDPTAKTLTESMGLVEHAAEGDIIRYAIAGGGSGKWVEVHFDPTKPAGHQGAGIVHHVAFRVADDKAQVQWRHKLTVAGLHVSEVMERNYFRSIYFREPGGVLFEIATDGPGMGVDEPGDTLGTTLRLPEWYEPHRATIITGLPKFTVPGTGVKFPAP